MNETSAKELIRSQSTSSSYATCSFWAFGDNFKIINKLSQFFYSIVR